MNSNSNEGEDESWRQFRIFLGRSRTERAHPVVGKHELGKESEVCRVVLKPLTLSPGRRLMGRKGEQITPSTQIYKG